MSVNKIKTGRQLADVINSIVAESVTQIKRQLREDSETDDKKLKAGNVSTDDIIEKLNSIRSGKSFKDSQIKTQMDTYVNSLSVSEKTALFAFLKGISQLVTGEVEGDHASDPSENPSNVKMKKKNVDDASNSNGNDSKTQHVKIKPNVVTLDSIEDKPKEDTEAPIKVK